MLSKRAHNDPLAWVSWTCMGHHLCWMHFQPYLPLICSRAVKTPGTPSTCAQGVSPAPALLPCARLLLLPGRPGRQPAAALARWQALCAARGCAQAGRPAAPRLRRPGGAVTRLWCRCLDQMQQRQRHWQREAEANGGLALALDTRLLRLSWQWQGPARVPAAWAKKALIFQGDVELVLAAACVLQGLPASCRLMAVRDGLCISEAESCQCSRRARGRTG